MQACSASGLASVRRPNDEIVSVHRMNGTGMIPDGAVITGIFLTDFTIRLPI
jgi:hypothetical protein